MRNAIHFLGGSVTVYALMAACSAGSKGKPGDHAVSTAGAANHGIAMASGGVDASGDPTAGSSAVATSGMGGIIGEMMDPVPDAEAESGSRLKAKYYVGADGSKQFAFIWRDTERNEDCSFQRAEDGSLRCLPPAGAAPSYFADAACTQPVTLTVKQPGACGAPPAQLPTQLYLLDSCGARKRYSVAAAPVTSGVHIGSGMTCTLAAAVYYDTLAFYPLTAPEAVPVSAFVAATEQVE
jgi:hypothetical protein